MIIHTSMCMMSKNQKQRSDTMENKTKKSLTPHLKKLFDTPAKRARAEKIMKEARDEEKARMTAKGYKLKGNKWVKYKKK